MKLNFACMDDILIFLEENLKMKLDTSRNPYKHLSNIMLLNEICEGLKEKYPDSCEVYYALCNLNERGLIVCKDGGMEKCHEVHKITYDGHLYLDKLRNKNN